MLILISVIVKLPAFPLALVPVEGPLLAELKCDEALVEDDMEGAAAD
jgi:hypothetical protein